MIQVYGTELPQPLKAAKALIFKHTSGRLCYETELFERLNPSWCIAFYSHFFVVDGRIPEMLAATNHEIICPQKFVCNRNNGTLVAAPNSQ